jgi:hypothetical protein
VPTPVRARDGPPLGVANGYQRHIAELAVHVAILRQIEPPVQGGDDRARRQARQWVRQVVEMIVDHVELAQVAREPAQRHRGEGHKILVRRVSMPQRPVDDGNEVCRGSGVVRREQGDVVAQTTSSSVSVLTTRSVPP